MTDEEKEVYLLLCGWCRTRIDSWAIKATDPPGPVWSYDGGPPVTLFEAFDMEIHKEYYDQNPYYS
jgi:hypothetical protein